jgi:hypothetical protein
MRFLAALGMASSNCSPPSLFCRHDVRFLLAAKLSERAMPGIDPWVSVAPATNPDAILGKLPMTQGSVTFPISASVVLANATGILF